eukprot:1666978-Rhodomonas_salina.1
MNTDSSDSVEVGQLPPAQISIAVASDPGRAGNSRAATSRLSTHFARGMLPIAGRGGLNGQSSRSASVGLRLARRPSSEIE